MRQTYELKSSDKIEGKRVVDGAYATMLARIRARDAPALVLLRYRRSSEATQAPWFVDRLVAIHPVFLTDAVVEARKPLSIHARRAGWQGCNLRLDRIPPEGRVAIVEDGEVVSSSTTRTLYQSSMRLAVVDPKLRAWTGLVLRIVRDIDRHEFRLVDVYARKKILEQAFPENHNVDAKIRQQLQVLRELGYLRFSGRGVYEVIS